MVIQSGDRDERKFRRMENAMLVSHGIFNGLPPVSGRIRVPKFILQLGSPGCQPCNAVVIFCMVQPAVRA
jgi:hypothetical protein